MIRIAFVVNVADNGWSGGVNYFRNLLWAIHNLQSKHISPILFVGSQTPSSLLKDFPPIEVIRTQALDRKAPLWWVRGVFLKLLDRDVVLEKIFSKANIDIVSHRTGWVPKLGMRSIGWIPDFQHIHYPEFFSEEELNKRDREFKRLAERSDAIVLSSHHAENDFKDFIKESEKESHVLNFAIPHSSTEVIIDFKELQENYKIEKRYFYLPNQFWAHKNHRIVIDALVILKQEGSDVVVVSTGKVDDHRAPEYFPNLMKYAEEMGVSDNFKVLGSVPYKHILPLMKNAIAVINPSLFEGWSTTVEEAKSLGKRILLSDIEVHREQKPERGIYFNANDSVGLAVLMKNIIDDFDPHNEDFESSKAVKHYSYKFLSYGKEYEQIVLNVCKNKTEKQVYFLPF